MHFVYRKKPVKTVEDMFAPPAKRETKDFPEPKKKPSQGMVLMLVYVVKATLTW